MNKKSNFLQAEYMTNAFWDELIDDGVKVIVPSQMLGRFHKLQTEKDLNSENTDFKKLKKDYDIFGLSIVEEFVSDNNVSQYEFDVSENVSDSVAFICVPKDFDFYKDSRQLYLEHLKIALEDYYNDADSWNVQVIDENEEEVDSCWIYYIGEFDEDVEEWFEKCKSDYGVSDEEIKEVKADIIDLYKAKKSA